MAGGVGGCVSAIASEATSGPVEPPVTSWQIAIFTGASDPA